jgi:membrane fusion protein, heavy metal efflux system
MPIRLLRPSNGRACRHVATAFIALALLAGCGHHVPASPPAAEPTRATVAAPDGFQLTDDQLRSMSIELVAVQAFHSQAVTDGRIAYDGDRITSVFSPYSGRVTRVLAPLGATVRRGQPLFDLEASEYAQAGSDLLSAAAQQKLAAASEQRRHAQFDARSGSLQDWQQAQNDLAAANAALAAVRNRLRILGRSDSQIDAVLASGRPQAGVEAAAPIGGVVVDRQIGSGEVLQAGGATPVYTIADLSKVWIVANVREADAPLVHAGEAVTVRVLAIPDREFSGHLDYVAATVDPSTRRVAVHAVLDNAQQLLKPEMLAQFTIATSEDSRAPSIPEAAVVFDGSQARAWVMRDGHSAALRTLTLGRLNAGHYEVLSGLTEGERVITRGALFIDRAASGD